MAPAQPATFLIADISGYTGYLADVELDHAQDILADLIGAVVTALRPGLPAGQARGRRGVHVRDRRDRSTGRCCSTRSSAATSASGGAAATSARRRRASATPASGSRTSTSSSSSTTARRSSRRSPAAQELLGSDVIVVHRLLKNEVVERLGIEAYALLSQAVHRCRRARPGRARHARAHARPTTGSATCRAGSHDLERRWQEEEARARVFVAPEDSTLIVSRCRPTCRRRSPGSS